MLKPLVVQDFLERAEIVYPNRIAVVDEPDQLAPALPPLTYRELGALVRAQAARLDDLGVPFGGRVAIVSQNSARLLHSFFGVSAYGRILVPINFRLTAPEVEYIVHHSGAHAVWVDPSHASLLDNLKVPHRFVLGDDDNFYMHGVAPEPWRDYREDTTATINYTSGTTAKPKGVQLTHRNLWLNACILALHAGVSDRDVYLHTLPMFHVNGWGMPYALTALGGQHIVLRQIDGAEILNRIERHQVTLLCAAPAVLNAVLDAARDWSSGCIPGSGRVRVIAAGAPPSTRTITRVLDELGWEFLQLYGLTETSPLTTINRHRAEWDGLANAERAQLLGRAGPPALGVRVEVDSFGEVRTTSNHTLTGYLNDPASTADALAGGWFHTGDVGRLDDDGYLVISDRRKDVIITGGENVSSIEVEEALTSHSAIREAAVIGIPDDRWGELVTAIVVSDDSALTADALAEHCRLSLAGYKVPKRFEFRTELPRTATGKLQKYKLRETFWQSMERQVN